MDYSKQIDQILTSVADTDRMRKDLLKDLLETNTDLLRTVNGLIDIVLSLDPEYVAHHHAKLDAAQAQDDTDRKTIRSEILQRYGIPPTDENLTALANEIYEYERENDACDCSDGSTYYPPQPTYSAKVLIALKYTDLPCEKAAVDRDLDSEWKHPLDRSVYRHSKRFYPEDEEDCIERLSAETANSLDALKANSDARNLIWIASSLKGSGWFL